MARQGWRTHPTTQAVIAWLDKERPMTQSKIAEHVGVSRERVRQICERLGRYPKYPYKKRCLACHVPLIANRITNYCRQHRPKVKRLLLSCCMCGKSYIRQAKEFQRLIDRERDGRGTGKTYCSRECFGRWLGLNYGSGLPKKERSLDTHDQG